MQNMSGGKTALGLDANVGALLCYLGNLVCALGLIYSIIVIVTDKQTKLTRFHAFQSIFLTVAGFVLYIPVYILMIIGMLIDPTIGAIISGLLSLVIFAIMIAIFVFIVISAIKAYKGEMYKIPVVGGFAEKYA